MIADFVVVLLLISDVLFVWSTNIVAQKKLHEEWYKIVSNKVSDSI